MSALYAGAILWYRLRSIDLGEIFTTPEKDSAAGLEALVLPVDPAILLVLSIWGLAWNEHAERNRRDNDDLKKRDGSN